MVECTFCKCFLESCTKQSEKSGQDEDDHSEVSCLQNDKNRLKNWENWMIRRANINKKLSAKLNRPFGELLMNAAEEYRNVKEEKILFENMKININFDKYRGNPDFWHLPPSLEEHCRTKCRKKCPCEDPVYFAVKTCYQKNEIPKMEYIGISKHILEEKNVLPRTRNIYALWKKNPYRKALLNKIRVKLKHLEPHRPESSSLIVLGSQKASVADGIEEKSGTKLQSSSSSNDSESSDYTVNMREFAKQIKPCVDSDVTIDVHDIDVVNLIINGTRIVASRMQKDAMTIRILFELGEVPTQPIINYIKLENKGKSTLRLHFAKYEKYITFKDIITTIRKHSPFYFDKRQIVLLPGKTMDWPIWFKPPSTGHFYETWKITAFPQIWSDSTNLLLRFQGIVYKEDFYSMSQTIDEMLTLRVRNTIINDTLRDIINSTKYESKNIIKYTYSEKHYFEAKNQEYWGAVKRPKYIYNKNVVKQLQSFYKQIRSPEDDVMWNYSVKHLKTLARKRDVLDYIENLSKKCEEGQRRAKYLQEIYSPHNVDVGAVQKAEQAAAAAAAEFSSKQMLVNKSQSIITKPETKYEALNKLLQKLQRPVMIENTEREKYATTYYILRYYLLKIGKELSGYSSSLLSLLNLNTLTKIEDTPERLLFEKFDVIWVERKRRVPPITVGEFPCRPKPKSLEDVPLDNPQMVYDRYFKKSAPTKGKTEKGPKENVEKYKKGKNKDTETKPLENVVVENFDPFADFVVPAKSQTMIMETSNLSEMVMSAGSVKSSQSSTLSYYEKYLIVYTNLAAAIDSMVAALETMKDSAIDTQILSELTNCKIIDENKDYNRWSVSTEKSGEEKEVSLEETDEYFEYLMKTHLTENINTQDYFIKGEHLPVVEDMSVESATLIKPIESFHLFTPTDGKSDTSANVKSGEMQTSSVDDDEIKPFVNILMHDEMLSELRVRSEETEESMNEQEESSEIFYFIENGL